MLRPEDAYEMYARAWNEPERALALLEECWARRTASTLTTRCRMASSGVPRSST